jgi:hypothetical protein
MCAGAAKCQSVALPTLRVKAPCAEARMLLRSAKDAGSVRATAHSRSNARSRADAVPLASFRRHAPVDERGVRVDETSNGTSGPGSRATVYIGAHTAAR